VVYEKCQAGTNHYVNPRENFIRHRVINIKAEECNGYLDYMHDYYHNLTSVTVFMHDDGLLLYSQHTDVSDAHTPFATFEPIVMVIKNYLTKEHPLLSLGVSTHYENWGVDEYRGEASKILWIYCAKPVPNSDPPIFTLDPPSKEVTHKPGGNFAIRREMLLLRPQATYFATLQQLWFADAVIENQAYGIMATVHDSYTTARQLWCAMEPTWHIFVGFPAPLPQRAMASEQLNVTRCFYCTGPEPTNDRKYGPQKAIT
jgi:hypothetical protein